MTGFARRVGRDRTPAISKRARSASSTSAPTARTRVTGASSVRPTAPVPTISQESPMTTKTMNRTESTAPALTNRPRRLRRSESIRSLVRETIVRPEDLIYPLFIVPSSRPKTEIGSMPGVFHLRVRDAVEEAQKAYDAGIRAVLLFGLPEIKDGIGSASWDPAAPVQQAIEAIDRKSVV